MHKMFLFQVNPLNQLLMPKNTLEKIENWLWICDKHALSFVKT